MKHNLVSNEIIILFSIMVERFQSNLAHTNSNDMDLMYVERNAFDLTYIKTTTTTKWLITENQIVSATDTCKEFFLALTIFIEIWCSFFCGHGTHQFTSLKSFVNLLKYHTSITK